MGTRCNVVFSDYEDGNIAALYIQWDGYPEGVGKQLAKILKYKWVVAGFNPSDERDLANGMANLVVQVVHALAVDQIADSRRMYKRLPTSYPRPRKYPLGNLYITPVSTVWGSGIDYVYTIYTIPSFKELRMHTGSLVRMRVQKTEWVAREDDPDEADLTLSAPLFDGLPSDYGVWLRKYVKEQNA